MTKNWKEVRKFGVDIIETYDKKGRFKTFHTQNWVEYQSGEKETTDLLIRDIRKNFENVVLIKNLKKTRKDYKGKEKYAYIKAYQIVEKGTIFLTSEQYASLLKSNSHHVQYEMKKHFFYYATKNFFRNSETLEYYFIDSGKKCLVNTNFFMGECRKEDLITWEKAYKNKENREIKKFDKCILKAKKFEDNLFPFDCLEILKEVYGNDFLRFNLKTIVEMVKNLMDTIEHSLSKDDILGMIKEEI